MPRRLAVAIVTALLCAAGSGAIAQELLVSAAVSLTNAFGEIGPAFERSRAGAKITFNFAASDVLLAQVAKGAPVDVFVSADEAAMNRGERAGLLTPGTRGEIASNALVVVTPSSASTPRSLADLARPAVRRIAIGTPQTVPAGRYARDALEAAGLWNAVQPKLVYAQNVRQALDYVARGEVDAGFVYATDAAAMRERVAVAFEARTTTPVRYPIAVVASTRHPELARAFVAFVQGIEAQRILARHGFGAPSP